MYEGQRDLGDGRSVWLQRKMFTWAIVIGKTEAVCYDSHWCFKTRELAESQFNTWNPFETEEPTGWIRHPQTGRRRPDGDASQEYVAY